MTLGYVARRVLQVPPALFGIVTLTFFLVHLAPGDPVLALAGESGDAAYYERMRARFGLDRPLPEQFVDYLANVARGDLGISYVHGRPVAEVILERLPATLLLVCVALAVSSVAGVALGALAAARPHGLSDATVRVITLLGYATPVFWLGQLALLTLALGLGWFPVQGMSDSQQAATGLGHALDVAHHLALPALVLAMQEVTLVAQLMRRSLLGEMGKAYVRTARAKGLSGRRVLLHHAMRNSLLPTVTIVGGRLGFLFSGAVLVEVVFAWPGLGRLLLSAVQTRDYPVLLGMFMLVAFGVVVANLVTDLLYGWLDPRIRYE
ncbi:MAG: ABC transporter permease [Actinomycetota bacterium]|nr:ABC transporter permease [Actinomycetota bacterium]